MLLFVWNYFTSLQLPRARLGINFLHEETLVFLGLTITNQMHLSEGCQLLLWASCILKAWRPRTRRRTCWLAWCISSWVDPSTLDGGICQLHEYVVCEKWEDSWLRLRNHNLNIRNASLLWSIFLLHVCPNLSLGTAKASAAYLTPILGSVTPTCKGIGHST